MLGSTEVLMRQSSQNLARRLPTAGTVAFTIAASAFLIAAAVGSVVRTGATAATATVLGGAVATGASAAALPDSTGAGTVLALAVSLLTLCGVAALALVRTSRTEHHTHD